MKGGKRYNTDLFRPEIGGFSAEFIASCSKMFHVINLREVPPISSILPSKTGLYAVFLAFQPKKTD